jgi:hypothetical protein
MELVEQENIQLGHWVSTQRQVREKLFQNFYCVKAYFHLNLFLRNRPIKHSSKDAPQK